MTMWAVGMLAVALVETPSHRFDFGPAGSPVAAGFTRHHLDRGYRGRVRLNRIAGRGRGSE